MFVTKSILQSPCKYHVVCRRALYWELNYSFYMLTRAVLRLECSLDCLSAPTYRYIAPRMIQRIILKFCGYVGCDDATNVSNFGYEPIKFNQLNQ